VGLPLAKGVLPTMVSSRRESPRPLRETGSRALPTSQETVMLHYAIVFFVIALIAALFGFGGIAAGAAGIAKILFFVFVIMAVVTFVMSLIRRS
jgi:uncharacterized membrane protein YtjA (UPF0391 family)